MIDEKQVKHVAKLARIALTDAEVKKFSGQLSKVFGYMEILNELDTDGAPPKSQVTGLTNVMEKDELMKGQGSREELLKCSELPVEGKMVRVLPAIKN